MSCAQHEIWQAWLLEDTIQLTHIHTQITNRPVLALKYRGESEG